jgi:hypothetical protein
MDATALQQFVNTFNSTFDGLNELGSQLDGMSDNFKGRMQEKIKSVRDNTANQLVDIMLNKASEDMIAAFKSAMGITS